MVWYSHLFQNFPQFIVIHTVKGFGIVIKAEIDVFFLELSCLFHDPGDVGNLISGSSAFSKTSLNVREFTVHVLLKSGLENFEHYFTSSSDSKESACNAGDLVLIPGKIPGRREWLPTPVFLSGQFHGQRRLVCFSPWVAKSQTRLSN